ncbi:hypothetical protein BBJ28_00003181 [Nothophytophthora sp. Chile5]|nr:hypothetical protein BBJ28_00003181 [Nothophytophthora sp. Chile5]
MGLMREWAQTPEVAGSVICARMLSEHDLPPAPTEALAVFEPFVQWLLAASPEELTSLPAEAFAADDVTSEGRGDVCAVDDGSSEVVREERRSRFASSVSAQLALAEAEGDLEAAWDLLSLARRDWGALDEKLLALQDERDENCEQIALLERRIIKLLQDRDRAIAETYTTEQQIQDAEHFKNLQLQRQQQQKARVASALRNLLRRSNSDDKDGSGVPTSPSRYAEKDVHRLQKELADTKVTAAVAKAELDARRHALRTVERQCAAVKLALAQASTEEDDLQAALQQLTRARRSSVDQLQQISLFSAAASSPSSAALRLAGWDDAHYRTQPTIMATLEQSEPKPVYFQAPDEEEEEDDQNPGAFMWMEGDSLAPPCQSDRDVVSKIVAIANVTSDDVRTMDCTAFWAVVTSRELTCTWVWQVLIDLGCGDGRICIEAAKRFGARARGVEIEEFLIERFRQLIAVDGLQELVSVSHGDLREEDLSDATVIVTYLLPEALDELTPKFTKLLSQKGRDVRIICNTWGIRGLTPTERHDAGPYGNVPLFVYRSSALSPHPAS